MKKTHIESQNLDKPLSTLKFLKEHLIVGGLWPKLDAQRQQNTASAVFINTRIILIDKSTFALAYCEITITSGWLHKFSWPN